MNEQSQQDVERSTREAGRAVSSQLAIVVNGARYDVSAVPGVAPGAFINLRVPHMASRCFPADRIHVVLGDGSLLACPRIEAMSCHAH